jgi:hypothetical protein
MALLFTSGRKRAFQTPGQAAATRGLHYAALVFLVGFLLHNADHFRRGVDAVSAGVLWAGSVSGLITLAAIGLVLLRHQQSAELAVIVGFGMAIGVSAVHLLPPWGALSDSLAAVHADPFTWIAVLAEIVGAAIFGWVGLRVYTRRK